jgi:hypothetical protein
MEGILKEKPSSEEGSPDEGRFQPIFDVDYPAASLSAFPGVSLTTFFALILISSPVCGFAGLPLCHLEGPETNQCNRILLFQRPTTSWASLLVLTTLSFSLADFI